MYGTLAILASPADSSPAPGVTRALAGSFLPGHPICPAPKADVPLLGLQEQISQAFGPSQGTVLRCTPPQARARRLKTCLVAARVDFVGQARSHVRCTSDCWDANPAHLYGYRNIHALYVRRRVHFFLSMAATGTRSRAVVVDSVSVCRQVCSDAIASRKDVAVDLEGINLSRDGEICLIQLAVEGDPEVKLIDVVTLGQDAFGAGMLGSLLEDVSLRKLMYDVRMDADALFHQFNVRIGNVCDLQVLYCRNFDSATDPYLKGLGKALSRCPGVPPSEREELDAVKTAGIALFAPERGGSYEVWKQRPLRPILVAYASADVSHLHAMYSAWRGAVADDEMERIVERRMSTAINASETIKGRQRAIKDF